MQTQNKLLAAFLLSQRVEPKKLNEDTFEFNLEESDLLVAQFEAEDGYNCNIHRIALALTTLEAIPVWQEPEPEETNNSDE